MNDTLNAKSQQNTSSDQPSPILKDLFTSQEVDLFMILNNIVFGCPICVVGIVGNTINLAVFCKQGFSDTMNISMFALSFSDLCLLVSSLWINIVNAPWMQRRQLGFEPREIMLLTGGWPHICFSRITCWITVFITAERCLCITLPFKVKSLITPRVVVVAMTLIYLLSFAGISPSYIAFHFLWKVDSTTNQTYLGTTMLLTKETQITSIYLQTSLQFASFLSIVLLTFTLVVQLQRSTRWRASATSGVNDQAGQLTSRDKKIVRMIISMTAILIVCFLPGNLLQVTWLIEPKFVTGGQYNYGQMVCWLIAFLMETVNSSSNTFVYFNMSSKYRETFYLLLLKQSDAVSKGKK